MSVEHHKHCLHLTAAHFAVLGKTAHRLVQNALNKLVRFAAPARAFEKADSKAYSACKQSADPTLGISEVCHRAIFVYDHSVLFIKVVAGGGDLSAEQSFELRFVHVAHLAAVI